MWVKHPHQEGLSAEQKHCRWPTLALGVTGEEWICFDLSLWFSFDRKYENGKLLFLLHSSSFEDFEGAGQTGTYIRIWDAMFESLWSFCYLIYSVFGVFYFENEVQPAFITGPAFIFPRDHLYKKRKRRGSNKIWYWVRKQVCTALKVHFYQIKCVISYIPATTTFWFCEVVSQERDWCSRFIQLSWSTYLLFFCYSLAFFSFYTFFFVPFSPKTKIEQKMQELVC